MVFVGFPAALILPILINGNMLYGADVSSVFHYSRIVIADALRHGRLPVWDPHIMCGFPLLAELQNAVFYPPTWFCLILPAGVFWTLSALVHLALSGVFVRCWMEKGLGVMSRAAVVGGVVYMMSGFIAAHLYSGHVNYVWGYPWIPAALWRLERYLAAPTLKRGVLLAVVLAMLFLAGMPQFVFFTGLLAGARLVHFVLVDREGRRERLQSAAKSAGWLFLGLFLCGPQLFPTLELIGQMHRGRQEDENFMFQYSIHPKEIMGLILGPETPDTSGYRNLAAARTWETNGFIGGGAFLLAVLAFLGKHRQRHLWAGVAVIGLLLALGSHIPFYWGFVAAFPGAGLFRGPGRYLFLFTIAISALAALGFHALWSRERRAFRVGAALLGLVAVVQLVAYWKGFFLGVGEKNLVWSSKTADKLREWAGTESRFASSGLVHVSVVGKCQAAGLDHLCGYDPMMLRRYAELMNVASYRPIDSDLVVLAAVGPHPVMDMLGARIWFGDSKPSRDVLARIGGMELFANEKAFPRAWLADCAGVMESRDERLKQMIQGPFNPARTVILESYPSEAPPKPSLNPGRTRVVSRGPGEYRIEAESDADAYLVLSEAWYPGWSAEVDGKPVEVMPANHLIQAVRLPAGKHDVRFSYHSRFLGAGFAVALLAALVPAFLSWRTRRSGASAAASVAPSTAGS